MAVFEVLIESDSLVLCLSSLSFTFWSVDAYGHNFMETGNENEKKTGMYLSASLFYPSFAFDKCPRVAVLLWGTKYALMKTKSEQWKWVWEGSVLNWIVGCTPKWNLSHKMRSGRCHSSRMTFGSSGMPCSKHPIHKSYSIIKVWSIFKWILKLWIPL